MLKQHLWHTVSTQKTINQSEPIRDNWVFQTKVKFFFVHPVSHREGAVAGIRSGDGKARAI